MQVPDKPKSVWIPGIHVSDREIRAVCLAVEAYDEALRFGRDEITGDWVVVIGEQGHPVYGFGRFLPDPETVGPTLAKHDVKRHGPKLMAQLAARAKREKAEDDWLMDENTGVLAEHFEHGFRKEGKHPRPQVFIPKGVPDGRS